jgi:hypothetical protein
MVLLINKADLIDRTRISANLSDKQIIPFIQDAHVYDLPTLFSGNMIADINAAETVYSNWSETVDYLPGLFAESNGFIWKALADNTNSLPTADNESWQIDHNATIRYLYLKEFLCWSAYRRLLLEHGRNITEAGITNPTDPQATYQPVSDKTRSEMIASATDKKNHHRGVIERYLLKYNLTTLSNCSAYIRRGNGRITAL